MLSGAGVPYLSAECGRDSYCDAVATAQSRFEHLLGIDYFAIIDFVPETGIEAFAITALPKCQKLVIRSLHIDAALIQRMKKASAIKLAEPLSERMQGWNTSHDVERLYTRGSST